MPRFFMHVRNSVDVDLQPRGTMLADLEAVRDAALAAARNRMGRQIFAGKLHLNERIDVEDETGAVVHSLPFLDAIEIEVSSMGRGPSENSATSWPIRPVISGEER